MVDELSDKRISKRSQGITLNYIKSSLRTHPTNHLKNKVIEISRTIMIQWLQTQGIQCSPGITQIKRFLSPILTTFRANSNMLLRDLSLIIDKFKNLKVLSQKMR